jgi:hypothetical protein
MRARKYDATVELLQPLEFAPRTTDLKSDGPTIEFTGRGSGAKNAEIEPNRNGSGG